MGVSAGRLIVMFYKELIVMFYGPILISLLFMGAYLRRGLSAGGAITGFYGIYVAYHIYLVRYLSLSLCLSLYR